MRVVHKFPLQIFGFEYTEVEVPQGEVVLVNCEHGITTVWIDKDVNEVGTMRLRMIPTGKEFDDTGMRHVGSVMTKSGYVWHIYRVY